MPKRRKQVRAVLDRRVIAEEALRLIDAEGLAGLSMRRLGAALGVEGMALYHHFANKGELLDGVLELLLEEIAPANPPADPLEHLRRLFEAQRQCAIAHPQAYVIFPTRRFATEAQFEFYERLLGIFRDAGFDAAESARYFRVLAGFVTGACLAEIASRGQQPDATPIRLENFEDREHYPLISAVVPHLRVSRLGDIFEFGLDMIFESMRKTLAARNSS
jgi:AcrR family transcriptional regulator